MARQYDPQAAADVIADVLRRNRERLGGISENGAKERIRASWKARLLRFLVGPYRSGLNLAWRLLIFGGQLVTWIVIPMAAICFAQVFAGSLNIESGHGALAAVVVYAVAIMAGIKTAREASQRLRAYARTSW